MAGSNKIHHKVVRYRAYILIFALVSVGAVGALAYMTITSGEGQLASVTGFDNFNLAATAAETCVGLAKKGLTEYVVADPTDPGDYYRGETRELPDLAPPGKEVWIAIDVHRAADQDPEGECRHNCDPTIYPVLCVGLARDSGGGNEAYYSLEVVFRYNHNEFFSIMRPELVPGDAFPHGDLNGDAEVTPADMRVFTDCLSAGEDWINISPDCDLAPCVGNDYLDVNDMAAALSAQAGSPLCAPSAQGSVFAMVTSASQSPNYGAAAYIPRYSFVNGSVLSYGASHTYGSVTGYDYHDRPKMSDLGTLVRDPETNEYLGRSAAFDIDNRGQVVGQSYYFGGGLNYHAFIWQNGVMTDLGTLGGWQSGAYAINEGGDKVAGYASTATGPAHAALWEYDDSTGTWNITDLGTLGVRVGSCPQPGGCPGYPVSRAGGINETAGWGPVEPIVRVVGSSQPCPEVRHAFLWESYRGIGYDWAPEEDPPERFPRPLQRNMSDLNSRVSDLTGWDSLAEATDINSGEQIVGWGVIEGAERAKHAFLLTPRCQPSCRSRFETVYIVTDLHSWGDCGESCYSKALAIGDDGHIVGVRADPDHGQRAVVWEEIGGAWVPSILNDMVDLAGNGWQTLMIANDVNVFGVIVGVGKRLDGAFYAFRLTPTPDNYTVENLGALADAPYDLANSAAAISKMGQVVGYASEDLLDPNAEARAFIYGERKEIEGNSLGWPQLENRVERPTLGPGDFGYPGLTYTVDGVEFTADDLSEIAGGAGVIQANGALNLGGDSTPGNPFKFMVFPGPEALTLDCNGYSVLVKGTLVADKISLENSNPAGECSFEFEPVARDFPSIVTNQLYLGEYTAPASVGDPPIVVINGHVVATKYIDTAPTGAGANFYGTIFSTNSSDDGTQDGTGFYCGPDLDSCFRPSDGARGQDIVVFPEFNGNVPYSKLSLINEVNSAPVVRVLGMRRGSSAASFSQYFLDNFDWPPSGGG